MRPHPNFLMSFWIIFCWVPCTYLQFIWACFKVWIDKRLVRWWYLMYTQPSIFLNMVVSLYCFWLLTNGYSISNNRWARNNSLNGTLIIPSSIAQSLSVVALENNQINNLFIRNPNLNLSTAELLWVSPTYLHFSNFILFVYLFISFSPSVLGRIWFSVTINNLTVIKLGIYLDIDERRKVT